MKIEGKNYRTIWFENNEVKIIDQTKLPHKFLIKSLKAAHFVTVDSYKMKDEISLLCGVKSIVIQNGIDTKKIKSYLKCSL